MIYVQHKQFGGVTVKRIYFAVGHQPLEEYLKNKLGKEYVFCGASVHKDSVIKGISKSNPNILIIRETLSGSIDILSLVYEIRNKFPTVRIIFIAGNRKPGDNVLANLVGPLSVWDVLYGEKVQAPNIVSLVRNKNEYKDISNLIPKPELNGKNGVSFKAPEPEVKFIEKEVRVIKEVVVSPPTNNPILEESIPNQSGSKDLMNTLFGSKNKTKEFIEGTIQSKQIFSFIGGKSGVGTTTNAYNTAVNLANKGYKTIFIEFDEIAPSVAYWLNIGFVKDGIDSALLNLENNELGKIDEAIIKTKELKNEERELREVYNKLPESLDFMFFSDNYITKNNDVMKVCNYDLIKELILYLVFQKGYDFVILDLVNDINHPITKSALLYSNRLIMNITQDISTIGYAKNKLKSLGAEGYKLAETPLFVLNKFVKSKFKSAYLKDWLESSEIISVVDSNTLLINANLEGVPLVIDKKGSKFASSISVITNILIQK